MVIKNNQGNLIVVELRREFKMSIPMEYIFQSGSCLKKDLYQLIIDRLKAAGWVDISSLASTDYVVLSSTGNTEDKQLLLNLRPIPAAGTAANNVTTSNFSTMSYRLQTSYTPGAAGVAGTFGRPSLAWTDLVLMPTAVATQYAQDTLVNYKVYADKNKIILALEYPAATGFSPIIIYLGQPDTTYMSESKNAGCICATSALATTAGSLTICDSPDGMGTLAAPYAIPTKAFLPSKSPNNGNIFITSDIIYDSTTEGFRGKLDGLLCVTNTNVLTGDKHYEKGNEYYTLCCHTLTNTSFPSQAILVRIN